MEPEPTWEARWKAWSEVGAGGEVGPTDLPGMEADPRGKVCS